MHWVSVMDFRSYRSWHFARHSPAESKGTKFISKVVDLRVKNISSTFTHNYSSNRIISIPIAHHEGNYFASKDDLKKLHDENCIAFEYIDNPNGASDNIAGILSKNHRVLGNDASPRAAH